LEVKVRERARTPFTNAQVISYDAVLLFCVLRDHRFFRSPFAFVHSCILRHSYKPDLPAVAILFIRDGEVELLTPEQYVHDVAHELLISDSVGGLLGELHDLFEMVCDVRKEIYSGDRI
jgi:hypothetical protein